MQYCTSCSAKILLFAILSNDTNYIQVGESYKKSHQIVHICIRPITSQIYVCLLLHSVLLEAVIFTNEVHTYLVSIYRQSTNVYQNKQKREGAKAAHRRSLINKSNIHLCGMLGEKNNMKRLRQVPDLMLLTCGYLFLDNIHEFEEHFVLYSTMKTKDNDKLLLEQFYEKLTC